MVRCVILLVLAGLCFSVRGSHLCKREFLFFEFHSSATVDDVKSRFDGVQVFYRFKAYGAGHYLFVVKNNQSKALRDLVLPADAIDTASVIPLETQDAFMERHGIKVCPQSLKPLPDQNLTLMERTWPATGLNEEQYWAMLREATTHVSSDPNCTEIVRFVAAGHFPTRCITFWNAGDCRSAEMILKSSDAFGGPGSSNVRLLKLYNL